MAKRPNIIFIVIDALRYDRLGVSGYLPSRTPVLDQLARDGQFYKSNFAVGCPTQISMPGVFTSSLPLDHGGYKSGIADRPRSFVEELQKNGYDTFGVSTVAWMSRLHGYDRGFDNYLEMIDMVQWLQASYSLLFGELIDRLEVGLISEADAIEKIRAEYPAILDQGMSFLTIQKKRPMAGAWRSVAYWEKRLKAEMKLLDTDPAKILTRKQAMGGDINTLGEAEVTDDMLRRAARSAHWDKRLNKYIFFRSKRRHYKGHEVNRQARHFLRNRSDKPFFMKLHYFEMHEAKLVVPSMTLRRAIDFPGDVLSAMRGRKNRHPVGILYDIGLANIDRQIGRLLKVLKSEGAEDTILVITSDHGMDTHHPNRGIGNDLQKLFFDEYLHVPFIIHGPGIEKAEVEGLMSHLDLGPSILELAGIEIPDDFRGATASERRKAPLDYVIAENTGRGWCDIDGKTIFMGVRTKDFKIVFQADDFKARERDVFDLANDPGEQTNLVDKQTHTEQRAYLMKVANERLEEIKRGRVATV